MNNELKARVEEENDLWSRKRRLPTNGDHRRHTLINGLFTALQEADNERSLLKEYVGSSICMSDYQSVDQIRAALALSQQQLHDTEARLQVAVEALNVLQNEWNEYDWTMLPPKASKAVKEALAKIKEMEVKDD